MTIRKQFVIATVAVAMFGSAVAVRAQKKSDGPSSQSYTTGDGQSYSAIAVRGKGAAAEATDVLVLFDTSASQAGEHRQAQRAAQNLAATDGAVQFEEIRVHYSSLLLTGGHSLA